MKNVIPSAQFQNSGLGPIVEQRQPQPLPTVAYQNPENITAYRIVSNKEEQESKEQELEVDRYWRTHINPKPKPKDNTAPHYRIQ